MQRFTPLLGRLLLSAIFLLSAVNKITDFSGTAEFMASAGLPATSLLLVGAIVLELAGGLMLLVGFKARLGAVLLIIFLIPATLVFHTDFGDQSQMIQFMKNLAILGGLLMVVAYGSGPLSLDHETA